MKGWVAVFLVAVAPVLTLLFRGVVWGPDSFAYWAVSCGNNSVVSWIHSPYWFVWFLQNIVACGLYQLVLIQFLLYFFTLVSVWIIGKHFFGNEGWRLPVYLGSLTPLFFIEVLRFEHELFGVAFAFVVVGLFCVYLLNKEENEWLVWVLAIPLACFSVWLWLPSVLILCLIPFLGDFSENVKKMWLVALLIVFFLVEWRYLLGSFNFAQIVAEELPLIGLIFVIHIIHFWKQIPGTLKFYALFLIFFGALKSKYMFLVSPLLLIGLLDKQLKTGIRLKRTVFGVKEIPVLYVCGILLIGWCLMGVSLYPSQSDMNEMRRAIQLSKDTNQLLYNDWGDGWMLVSLGYDTKYKASIPQPDWNKLARPFIAWSSEEIVGCQKLTKRTQQCT